MKRKHLTSLEHRKGEFAKLEKKMRITLDEAVAYIKAMDMESTAPFNDDDKRAIFVIGGAKLLGLIDGDTAKLYLQIEQLH